MRRRLAFTLIEVLVVLALLAITAAAAIPAYASLRRDPEMAAADNLVTLMTRARDLAREGGQRAELVLAPRDARYWITSGGSTEQGTLRLAPGQRFVAIDSDRVTCTFSAMGPATPCAIALRGAGDVIVRVDPWNALVAAERVR